MKKYILGILVLAGLAMSSCDVVIVEEPTPVVVYVDARDKFIGVYDAEEYSATYNAYSYYTIDIVKFSGHPGSILIRNFYGAGIDVIADVEGRYFNIPYQSVNGYDIEGEGSINGNQLSMSYSVEDYAGHYIIVDDCSIIAWR